MLRLSHMLIIDDHPVIARGLAEMLKDDACHTHIKSCCSLALGQVELKQKKYDIIFLDLMMPDSTLSTAFTFIHNCKKLYPDLLIVIVSSVMDDKIILKLFEIGVNGYLSKACESYEVKLAMEYLRQGQSYLSMDLQELLEKKRTAKQVLTKKEREVLRIFASGNNVKQTAALLHLSAYTIMAHRRNIMSKLDLHSGAALVKYAFEHKLVNSDEF